MREPRGVAPIGLAVMMATAVALPSEPPASGEPPKPDQGPSARAETGPVELRKEPIPDKRPVRVILPSPYAGQR